MPEASGSEVKKAVEIAAGLLGLNYGVIHAQIQDGHLVRLTEERSFTPAELESLPVRGDAMP